MAKKRTVTDPAAPAAEKYPNRYKKGVSGNPSGRPKKTPEQKEALELIRSLAPLAAQKMQEILANPKASLYAKIQVIDIILNRTYGKPEAALKLETVQESVRASYDRVQEMLAGIQAEEDEQTPAPPAVISLADREGA